MLMVMFTKVNGLKIWRMDLEFTHIKMAQNMKVTGNKINNMASELNSGQMVHPIRDSMLMDRNMVQASLLGKTAVHTMEHFITTILKVTVFIIGAINEYTKVTGKTTKWKAKVNLNGQMAESIMASTMMIRRKAKVFFTGQMVENTKVNG